MRPSLLDLCRTCGTRWQSVWKAGNTVVVDESVYANDSNCPCHVYIPRKPHPNGLLSYGLSGYTAVMRLPILLDIEPWLPGNKLSASESAQRLVNRMRVAHPRLTPHVVMDSLFGSFEVVEKYKRDGVLVTMSMDLQKKQWLWDLLAWECPLESGRAALFPFKDLDGGFLASLYHVQTDTGKIIDIRTISSAFGFEVPEKDETAVLSIGERRTDDHDFFIYETQWIDGDTTWEYAHSFMDADGTFNSIWLLQAAEEDIRAALVDLTVEGLSEVCRQQNWKVRSSALSFLFNLTLF